MRELRTRLGQESQPVVNWTDTNDTDAHTKFAQIKIKRFML